MRSDNVENNVFTKMQKTIFLKLFPELHCEADFFSFILGICSSRQIRAVVSYGQKITKPSVPLLPLPDVLCVS